MFTHQSLAHTSGTRANHCNQKERYKIRGECKSILCAQEETIYLLITSMPRWCKSATCSHIAPRRVREGRPSSLATTDVPAVRYVLCECISEELDKGYKCLLGRQEWAQ